MKQVFRVLWEALKDLWDELSLLILMNAVSALLVIPVVTFPPALAGLWHTANRLTNEKSIHWRDYFEGFRRYFWKAWGLALLNILVAAVVFTNISFYTPGNTPFEINPTLSIWIRGLFLGIVFLWLIIQMYLMALLLEQQDQRLRVALRNAAVLAVANPGFTLVLALLLLIVAVISTLFPVLWFAITLALFAVVCNKAVLHLLEPYREQTRGAEGSEAEQEEKQAADKDTPSGVR
jgi:uncharacterized membrane protein YesL